MLVWASLAIATVAFLMFAIVIGLVRATLESVGDDVSDVLDREP
jgi:hypothetical protein